jgi:hypothetical protein
MEMIAPSRTTRHEGGIIARNDARIASDFWTWYPKRDTQVSIAYVTEGMDVQSINALRKATAIRIAPRYVLAKLLWKSIPSRMYSRMPAKISRTLNCRLPVRRALGGQSNGVPWSSNDQYTV